MFMITTPRYEALRIPAATATHTAAVALVWRLIRALDRWQARREAIRRLYGPTGGHRSVVAGRAVAAERDLDRRW